MSCPQMIVLGHGFKANSVGLGLGMDLVLDHLALASITRP